MNTVLRLVAAAMLFVVMAARAANPLTAPNLADRVFRSGPDAVPSSAINVIGLGPTGNIYVAGPFNSVDGQSRPHGVARLFEDGTLDAAWSPSLPAGDVSPTRARESPAGAVALTFAFSGISRQALVLVPAGSSTGTEVDSAPNGYNELVFDDSGAAYVAAYGATTGTSSTGERPVDLYKLSASGTRDATFELTLHGDYNNCRFFTPALPNVNALLPSGGLLYIGGNFTSAANSRGGVGIGGALRVSASTGDPDSTWAPMSSTSPLPLATSAQKLTCFPAPSGTVTGMVAAGDRLYLAGPWERQGRKYLARFSLTGPGGVDPGWNPQVIGGLGALALDPSGTHLYVSGQSMTIGDVYRTGLAAISTSDASLAPGWDPNVAGPTSISVMRATSARLVIGGIFTTVHAVERVHLAGLPLAGALSNFSVLQLSPARLDFGNVAVETSATRTFTISNAGTAALPIQSITAPGTFASDGPTLTQTNDCPSTLAAGASCTVTVRLDSGRYYPGEILLPVVPGDGGTPQYVRLAWTLAYPQFMIEGGNGDFAAILVPPTPLGYSLTAARTVRNSGTYPLAITGVGIESQSGAGTFSQPTHDCPASLAPSATCSISVTYTPSAEGSAQAVVTVSFGTLTYYPYFNAGSYGFTRTGRISVASRSATSAEDSDSDGMPNSVEQAEGRNPVVKDNDIFGISRLFAMQQYRDFLAREGDAGGIAYWTGQLDSGALSRGQVIEYFLGSPEFQGTISPVARLYFAYFLRVPDYGGITFWIGYFRSGNTLDSISDFFAGSAEFQSRYGSLNNAQFVDLVYQNVLGRPPDPSGRAFWTAELDSGRRTRGQVMLGFSESSEYRSLSNSEVCVTMVYIGMLRRVPDPGGFAFWVNYLDQGNSVLALVNGVLGSAEYRGRFLP